MKKKVAIIGSGNIGTDLMMKILKGSDELEMAALVGIDPDSDGLRRARELGVATTHEGLEGLRAMPGYGEIAIVMDATSAHAHEVHHPVLIADGKQVIDLTPAA
ncbi:Gfo/Idh/MocA family oxidoreductase, partial [Sinisalibacter aestuarii]|uniref:Gfo/Idh/MocA family oxidoreductase n=1 Tax=Sinisalibacter aestuarii TaxID=2949426 RepID=UPI0033658764